MADRTVNDSQGASLVVLYTLPGAPHRRVLINDGAVTLGGSRLPILREPCERLYRPESADRGPPSRSSSAMGNPFTPDYVGLEGDPPGDQ